MQAVSLNRWLTIFASAGLLIAGQLWLSHSGIVSLPCTGGGCDGVARSPYSKIFDIPVATYGFLYFGVLILLSLSRLQNPQAWQKYGQYIQVLSTAGLLVFAYYTYLQFGVMKLKSPCWWCLSAAVANLLVFLIAWTERRLPTPAEDRARGELWWSLLIVLLALFAAGGLAAKWWDHVNTVHSPRPPEVLTLEKKTMLLRPGQGWSQGDPKAELTIVEFSDFQCPACKSAYDFLETNLLKQHGKKIYFIFRHYPLVEIHPMAWLAAAAAEEAGKQGKFWDMYHALFKNQEMLSREGIVQVAKTIKVDPQKVEQAMKSANKTGTDLFNKIYQDFEDGHDLGVNSTPTFIVVFRNQMFVAPGQTALTQLLSTNKEINQYLGFQATTSPAPRAAP